MNGTITDVSGIEVGHAQNTQALTGCSVVLCRHGAVVGADVRGLAPGTRETDLCQPGTLVSRVQSILLAGGSAFGLDAASGVMRYLWERKLGFQVGEVAVPIVPGAVIFDLTVGEMSWPDSAMGYHACQVASTAPVVQGSVGAGTGATVGKLLGMQHAMKGGVGSASRQIDDVVVGALAVVNAGGDVLMPWSNRVVAGARDRATGRLLDVAGTLGAGSGPVHSVAGANTTLGVLATDATLSPEQVSHLARSGHDAFARTIRPVHTLVDGDTVFALATGSDQDLWAGNPIALTSVAVAVLEQAVINAVTHAVSLGGVPAAGGR